LRNISRRRHRHPHASFRPARRTSVNAFLIYLGAAGSRWSIPARHLPPADGRQGARQHPGAGVDPASIDTVILTHMHPDHSAGWPIATPASATIPMPSSSCTSASHALVRRRATWPGRPSARSAILPGGREQVDAYKDRWRLSRRGEVFPGVTAIPRPGHTPGHTTYMISSGKEQLLIWGDTVHVPEVQTARPEVCMDFDTDKALARTHAARCSTWSRPTGCCHRHASAFSGLRPPGAGWLRLPAHPRGVAARAISSRPSFDLDAGRGDHLPQRSISRFTYSVNSADDEPTAMMPCAASFSFTSVECSASIAVA
jgi:glyoxylase-like metal-dependent hydrolase (beta-lactamase superfamily II)